MGSSSSKSSSSTATATTNVDRRQVVDHGVGVSSDSSTVSVTSVDLGAVEAAFGFADASGQLVAGSFDKVLKLADTVLTGSLNAADKSAALVSAAFETAKNTESGSIDQKTMMVLAGVAAVAFVAVKRGAK